jgi:hypothetical protein
MRQGLAKTRNPTAIFIVSAITGVSVNALMLNRNSAGAVGPIVCILIILAFWLRAYTLQNKVENSTLQQFADQSYYLGFIFTIALLAMSFISLGHSELTSFGSHFAFALAMTGVGLISRIHIESLAVSRTLPDTIDAQERLAEELERITYAMGLGTEQVKNLFEEQNKAMAENQKRLAEFMQTQAESLVTGLSESIADLRDLCTEVVPKSEIELMRSNFSEIRHTLSDSSATLRDWEKGIRHTLNESSKHISDNLGVFRDFSSVASSVAKSVEILRDNMVALEKHMSATTRAAETFADRAMKAYGALENLTSGLGNVQQVAGSAASAVVSSSGQASQSITTFSAAVSQQSHSLGSITNIVAEQITEIQKLKAEYHRLAQSHRVGDQAADANGKSKVS